MKIYCLPLELIAFAIHPGDTQSTTTVCVVELSRCLYISSQSNFEFSDVTVEKIHAIIDFLIVASHQYHSGHWALKKCEEDFWRGYCVLRLKRETASSQKIATAIDKIYNGLYHELWKKFLAGMYSEATLSNLKRMIRQVLVINDHDISFGKAISKTGVHGESRIIRFLFIRDYPTIYFAKTAKFFYLLPGDKLSAEVKNNARQWFREKLSAEPIAMGSSQGTCLGCCKCLDEFSIARGDPANKPQQWVDPLTLCGTQGTTQINVSDSHHAIFVAFKYLVRPPEDDEGQ